MDNEKRIRLLQFVTGTCRLPVGGFAELIGVCSRALGLGGGSQGGKRGQWSCVGAGGWVLAVHVSITRVQGSPQHMSSEAAATPEHGDLIRWCAIPR